MYKRDYEDEKSQDRQFKMTYPEPIMASYNRYLNFFQKCSAKDYPKQAKPKVVVMVSHGNSIQSFLEVTHPDAKKWNVIGVGYCCLSIASKEKSWTDTKWVSEMIGDATHVGCGTSDLLENFDDY